MAQTDEKSLTDKFINIYTGGGGGGASSWVVPTVLIAGLGVGGYFLYKKLFPSKGPYSTWIVQQIFIGIPVTEPTGAAAYWIPIQTLASIPTTTPTGAAAYWKMLHTVTSVPAITPTTAAAVWLLIHTLSAIPATTPTGVAAVWILMHTLSGIPATTPASVAAVWLLKQTLTIVPATAPAATPGITNVQIVSYPSTVQLNSPCTIQISFTYVGAAGSKALHAAIGQQGAFGFDEKSAINTSVYAPAATTPTTVTATVTIPTTGLPGGVYGLTAKVEGVESGVYQNVLTILGSTTPIVTNVQIANYPTSLPVGNNCNLIVNFTYVGPATSLSAHAAIGQQGALGFDEKSAVNITVSVPACTTPTALSFSPSIPTTGLPAGLYGLTAKINAVESGVLSNVVTLTGSSTPVISNVRITSYPTSTLTPGSSCPITVAFDYVGPATTAAFHAALGNKNVWGFDEISGCTVDSTISIAAAGSVTTKYFNAVIPVKAGLANGVYDLYCKLGGVFSPEYLDVIVVQAAVTPTLTIADDTIQTGDSLSFSFTGFQPYASVSVYVVGGGGLNITANSAGAGSGSFQIGEGAGTYTLKAEDSYGHSATDTFTVSSSGTPTITNVRITNIPTYTITPGVPIPVTILFDYVGSASVKAFHAALGIKGLISFDEITGCTVDSSISIPAASSVTTFSFGASIPTKAGLSGLYDLYCKLGGVQSPIYNDLITIG